MEKTFEDIKFDCKDCGKTAVWTKGEQEFMYELKEKGKLDEEQPDGSIKPGEVKPPKRCAACRQKRRAMHA